LTAFLLPFVVACGFTVQQSYLMSLPLLMIGQLLVLPLVFFCQRAWCLVGLLSGCMFASQCLVDGLEQRLPGVLEGQDLVVIGRVVSLPQVRPEVVRFRLRLESCGGCQETTVIRLNWYRPGHVIIPGQVWQLPVKLSRPRGLVIPGLFDYQGWLFRQGINATGYVRPNVAPQLLDDRPFSVPHHRLRYFIRQQLLANHGSSEVAGLMVALALGVSDAIDAGQWRQLSRTGTNHLLIISGLHVGLVAAGLYWLLRQLLRHQRTAAMLTLVLTFLYGAVAGLGLPVQRSLVMLLVALLATQLSRRVSPAYGLLVALAIVTIIDPLAVLSAGFWLSFSAVALLLFGFVGRTYAVPRHRVWQWLHGMLASQWIVFVGITPLLFLFVYQVSLAAMPVNLIAIPWVSLTVVPPILISMVLMPVASSAAEIAGLVAEWSLTWLWQFVGAAAALNPVFPARSISLLDTLFGMAGAVLLLAPKGLMPRWPGLIAFLPLLCGQAPGGSSDGDAALLIRVLDVGQGLAVILRSRHHVFLFDTGPRSASGFDAGEQIVLPSLKQLQVRRIDALTVSHEDLDHRGGLDAIQRDLPVLSLIDDASGCHGRQFEFDAIQYRLLSMRDALNRNDRSCILLIRFGPFSALLPGDIELDGERFLLDQDIGAVNLLVSPHHGSISSSTPAFLNRIQPEWVVVSSGYRNRFHHPHPKVIARYLHRQAGVINTATAGAVDVRVWQDGHFEMSSAVDQQRFVWHRY
jgi:competence protein ComEC